jgi:hypothetical protein
MFCSTCGAKASGNSKFCSECGASLQSTQLSDTGDSTLQTPIIADLNCSACNQVSLKFIKNVKSTILLLFSVPIGLIGIYFFIHSRVYPTRTIEDLGFLIFIVLSAGMNFFNQFKVFQCCSCGEYSLKMRFSDTVYPAKLKDIDNPMFYIEKS